ncbi:MAG: pyridoxal phosphate-dependent aminotransferase [Betaproteobacteria bacterium]|nr:MAG: pyridoxal phosphate-dependent aminotransferase [Betaproteobacteria bacterium]
MSGTRTAWPLARRVDCIEPFHVMALLARARELEAAGRSIIHMEIGEPDFPTPEPIRTAGARAIEQGRIFYTPALGMPALRRAIAGFYQARYGVTVDAGRVIVTPGASGALLLVMAALVNPGDEVLLADPGYPANRHFVRLMDGVPIGVAVGPDSNYQLRGEHLERHWTRRTAAALVATPSNPTGTLLTPAELNAMAEFTAARGGALIVDEIYHGLVYDAAAPTALALRDDVFVINSFSKYFNMTGWRLGWMVAPARYVEAIDRLAQNFFLAAPTPAQYAALAAFEPATLALLDARRDEFRARRDFLLPALRELGFGVPQLPQGAFYIYANCSRFTADSFGFARELLEQAGVAIAPGADFGDNAAAAHVRFAYTQPVAVLREGVARIAQFLGR